MTRLFPQVYDQLRSHNKDVNSEAQHRLSKVSAIYFDLDDTLCGYWNATKAGLRSAFEQNPIEGKSVDEMIQGWADVFRVFSSSLKDNTPLFEEYLTSGYPTRLHQMKETLLHFGVDDSDHAERLCHSYMVERDRNLKLFDDAIDVLEKLAARYPLGLITNGPADIQNQEINTTGIRKYLSNIFIEGEMRIGKPHRTVFERAENAVNKSPEELVMIGNSYGHDIRPAIEYGWATIWTRRDSDVAPSSRTGKPEEIPTGEPLPTLTVSHLSEILPYFEV
jgi:putative hydrolase of the HAD superfamily